MNLSDLSRRLITISLVLIFSLGIVLRLTDLDDPPLDFNPTRQLRSAIIARGIYYEHTPESDPGKREQAISQMNAMERLEPPILESLVAFVYRLVGQEILWVSRIFTTIFWLVGAWILYVLGRRMASPWAVLVGVGYYLFLPFSIRASRSFQPDPGMAMFILLTAWALFRWSTMRSWKWAIMAGLLGGATAYLKASGIFFVGGMAIAMCILPEDNPERGPEHGHLDRDLKQGPDRGHLGRKIIRNTKQAFRNPQRWVMMTLIVLPALLYYLLETGEQPAGYSASWTVLSHWRELLAPSFYMRWMIRVDDILMLPLILAGFIGTLVATPKLRALLWGLWGGYLLFGLTFPYHIVTHDYYHLPLVGIVSLSLVPLADLIIRELGKRGKVPLILFASTFAVFCIYNGWIGRSILLGQDFRDHPAFWQQVGNAIPADTKAIGLTQDYGFRLMYYGWRKITLWPPEGNSEDFEALTAGTSYFVITAKNQLTGELSGYLEDHFPVYAQGSGYLIYDLREPE
jgi:hypothetical protein